MWLEIPTLRLREKHLYLQALESRNCAYVTELPQIIQYVYKRQDVGCMEEFCSLFCGLYWLDLGQSLFSF